MNQSAQRRNVGFVSNLTYVCFSYFNFYLALSKEHSLLFFFMIVLVFCTNPRRLVMLTIGLTLPCLLNANHNRGGMQTNAFTVFEGLLSDRGARHY